MIETWPTVGRSDEVAAILSGLARGVGTVVIGEAGVGKTVLGREVRRRVEADGWSSVLVLCSASPGLKLPTFAQYAGAGDAATPGSTDQTQPPADNARRSVLVVDDAHLLDDESADILWRLADSPTTVVVALVRSGRRLPDRVARLLTDGVCDRLDLAPLSEGNLRTLLELVLGGDVEDRLPRLLARRAVGNALLVRELVRSGVESGAIVCSHGVWRLAGALPVGVGAADLIRGSLAQLDSAELKAAQVIAVGEPLRLAVAEATVGRSLLEGLEDKQVVALEDTPSGPMITLGHPLYGAVLRADVAPLRLRRLRRELIDSIRLTGTPSPFDRLRSVLWSVDLGQTVEPDELMAAARMARSYGHDTAERLARVAVATDGSPVATALLAEILVMQGRVAEADSVLDALASGALSVDEHRAVTYARAMGRTRLGEVAEVAALVLAAGAEASDEVDGLDNPRLLQAISAQALAMDGKVAEATVLARPLAADVSADPVTRTLAACTVAVGGSLVGCSRDSELMLERVLPSAEAARSELPYGLGAAMVATAVAMAQGGRLDDADRLGHQIYDRALADDDEWLRPRGATALGVTALMRGQPRTATRYLRIAVASLNGFDAMFLRYNLSFLVRALTITGAREEARRTLESVPDAPRLPIFQPDWEIAEAALMAAEGAFELAAHHALRAARHAASLGLWSIVGIAATESARYHPTPDAALLVATAAEQVEDPLLACLAVYAQAGTEDNPRALEGASVRLEEMGMVLHAAEASYVAARGYRMASKGSAAATAAARATALHARCEHAVIPWVAGFQAPEVLTRREQQIALLAAAGHPDMAIAAETGISVRTVQNHLGHSYRKLGISGRHQLADALTSSGEAHRPS